MKRVLIITYYWPPSGGGGVQRWLKFAKYLPKFDWEPVIFTPENPDFHIMDDSLLGEVDPNTEVIRFPIWEPTKFLPSKNKQGQLRSPGKKSMIGELMIWIRGNFFFPDQRKFWIKPAVSYLEDFLERNKIDCVVTTGPPHSMHLIGRNLKRKTGIKWVADFRDPWTKWDLLEQMKLSAFSKKKHQSMERSVLEEADLVLAASESWAREFHELGGNWTAAITNGFDPEDFKVVETEKPGFFQIGHYGLINEFREPRVLIEVLKKLCSRDPEFRSSLKVKFAGIIHDGFREIIEKDVEVSQFVEFQDYIPHDELIFEYSRNYVLLLIQNESSISRGHIPGKFFEYLAARRWILFQGSNESDLAGILEKTGAGDIISVDDPLQMEQEILKLYKKFKENEPFPDTVDESFTRKNLTQKLASHLNQIIS